MECITFSLSYMADNHNHDNQEIDVELYRCCAPRAGYWLGVLPTHPAIEAMRMNPPMGLGALPPYPGDAITAPAQDGRHPMGYAPPVYPFPPAMPAVLPATGHCDMRKFCNCFIGIYFLSFYVV